MVAALVWLPAVLRLRDLRREKRAKAQAEAQEAKPAVLELPAAKAA
jgi:hypothetical protein